MRYKETAVQTHSPASLLERGIQRQDKNGPLSGSRWKELQADIRLFLAPNLPSDF
jgi:hypothetical protein